MQIKSAVTVHEKAAFEALAAKRGVTLSDLIRDYLSQEVLVFLRELEETRSSTPSRAIRHTRAYQLKATVTAKEHAAITAAAAAAGLTVSEWLRSLARRAIGLPAFGADDYVGGRDEQTPEA